MHLAFGMIELDVPPTRLTQILHDVAASAAARKDRGSVASYIPELASVPASRFGCVIADCHGVAASIGDDAIPFSLQSLTKVFAIVLSLNIGGHEIWQRVGKEPSGTPFNFLAQLEAEAGVPRNPFINAGALVVTDYLMGKGPRDAASMVRDYLRICAGSNAIAINDDVARSELASAHKNRAIANLLYLHGVITNDPEAVLACYCRQCAISANLRDVTAAFLPFALGGYAPAAAETVMSRMTARRVNALMMTCGLYDAVGSFAFRVGLPAKSGVGGGVLAVVPGKAAIGTWSPGLDRFGNSLIGVYAMEEIVRMLDFSLL